MATNKHAIIRYQALDKCFSNFGRRYYIDDLVEACEEALYQFSGVRDGVKRRQIFADIAFMESDEGYSILLDRIKDGHQKYYRYSDRNYSINRQPLSQRESEQLKNTILMLNRFKGLPQFDWMGEVLTRLEDSFKLNSSVNSVVSFEQNPYLKGLDLFTDLFNAIINKQVLKIQYNSSFKGIQTQIIHPYHLKQFNSRWFLLGWDELLERISTLALDRIEKFSLEHKPYIENDSFNFETYFDDVVGVTIPRDRSVERIRLKIDKARYNYIATKPFHPTQKVKERGDDYVEIELELIPNYEFETLLLGFADSIEILEPITLKKTISDRAKRIFDRNI